MSSILYQNHAFVSNQRRSSIEQALWGPRLSVSFSSNNSFSYLRGNCTRCASVKAAGVSHQRCQRQPRLHSQDHQAWMSLMEVAGHTKAMPDDGSECSCLSDLSTPILVHRLQSTTERFQSSRCQGVRMPTLHVDQELSAVCLRSLAIGWILGHVLCHPCCISGL